jgi:hypothetical protein
MSLMRFLSAGGRGLANGAPPMGRYRLPDGRVLPNFGGKNPFGTKKTSPSQSSPGPATGVTAKAALTQAAPPLPVDSPVQTPARCLGRPCAAAPQGRRARLLNRLKALRAWRPWRRASQAAGRTAPPMPGGPVQGELRLDNVRVVRNDLSDTDYEVVSAETSTASPVRSPGQPRSAKAMAPLGRLAERLFGGPS